jgi:hypothetical protein
MKKVIIVLLGVFAVKLFYEFINAEEDNEKITRFGDKITDPYEQGHYDGQRGR